MTEPGPTISPDGKHHWDGQRWVAAHAPLVAQPWYATSIGDLRRRSARAQVIFAVFVGLLVLITVSVVASLVESERASDIKGDLNTASCEDMGYGPAECPR